MPQLFESLITPGSLRNAVLLAIGANASHRLRGSNEGKRKAVQTTLDDEELRKLGNRKFASQCCVAQWLAGEI